MNELRGLSALLLVVGLLCLWSWHREAPPAVQEDVPLWPGTGARLQQAEYRSGTATVTVRPDADYVWFRVRERGVVRGYVGNENAQQLVDRLQDLRAIRSLGRPDDLAALGLARSATLTVVLQARDPIRFRVGDRTLGSAGDRYVQVPGGEVFLVDAALIEDLANVRRLRRTRLRDALLRDVTRIELEWKGQTLTAIQQNRRDRADAFWAREDAPAIRDEPVEELVRALERVTLLEYPAEPEPSDPWLRVVWYGDEGELTEASFADGPAGTFLARSGQSHRWATAPRAAAEQLRARLKAVLAGS